MYLELFWNILYMTVSLPHDKSYEGQHLDLCFRCIFDRSSATKPLTNREVMAKLKKSKSIQDILVTAKIAKDRQGSRPQFSRFKTCQYCTSISHSGNITRHAATKSLYPVRNGNCQSNNCIYMLRIQHLSYKVCWSNLNRMLDKFQSHLFT